MGEGSGEKPPPVSLGGQTAPHAHCEQKKLGDPWKKTDTAFRAQVTLGPGRPAEVCKSRPREAGSRLVVPGRAGGPPAHLADLCRVWV